MSQQAENIGFKATTVFSMMGALIVGISGLLAMHNAGISTANNYTDDKVKSVKENIDLRINPLERDIDEIKKKIGEFPYR